MEERTARGKLINLHDIVVQTIDPETKTDIELIVDIIKEYNEQLLNLIDHTHTLS